MTTYIIEKKIEVSKEEYLKHLEDQVQYWKDRLTRFESEAEVKISRFIKKQELRATELQAIVMRKEAELKALKSEPVKLGHTDPKKPGPYYPN